MLKELIEKFTHKPLEAAQRELERLRDRKTNLEAQRFHLAEAVAREERAALDQLLSADTTADLSALASRKADLQAQLDTLDSALRHAAERLGESEVDVQRQQIASLRAEASRKRS